MLAVVVTVNVFHAHCSLSRDARFSLTVTVHLSPRLLLPPLSLPPLLFLPQFVPQLILGSALDSSSGPPEFHPAWHTHTEWAFGAHYFFETWNETTKVRVLARLCEVVVWGMCAVCMNW